MAAIENLPLIAIVGPTASGKTELAIKIAQKYNGEIICADSRTVYKEMDIGTAKPTIDEQSKVPHWGLDLALPGEPFSAAKFKRYAESKINEIRERGRLPLLVGGTGLYIDGIIFDYQFGPAANTEQRAHLETQSTEELLVYCVKNNVTVPENNKNKRYIIRAIEQNSINTRNNGRLIDNSIVVGIATDNTILRMRIAHRAEQLFKHGVVEEATLLGKKYGWKHESMTGNVYPLIHSYLEDGETLTEVIDKFTTLDWRLAKRQMTWFRRNPHIEWCTATDAIRYIDQLLAPEQPL